MQSDGQGSKRWIKKLEVIITRKSAAGDDDYVVVICQQSDWYKVQWSRLETLEMSWKYK